MSVSVVFCNADLELENEKNGTVLLLSKTDYNNLEKTRSRDLAKLLCSKYKTFQIDYDSKKEVCQIPYELARFSKDICPYLSENATLLVTLSIPSKEDEENYTLFVSRLLSLVSYGYGNPYVSNSELLTMVYPCKDCIVAPFHSALSLLEDSSHQTCSNLYRFDSHTLTYLQNLCYKNNEMAGNFQITKIDDDLVNVMSVIKSSIKEGDIDEVDVSVTRYNFHTHPKKVYEQQSVVNGWPSLLDFIGYHRLGLNTIFHAVATMEGLYIMKFHKLCNPKKVPKSFISKNFDVDHRHHYTPKQFVTYVNSIQFQNTPVFEIVFYEWKDAGEVFQVHYMPINNSCLVSQSVKEFHHKLFRK